MTTKCRFADMPKEMHKLPVDDKGYPIPWFVGKDPDTGIHDTRYADPDKFRQAMQHNRCWVCGGTLGSYKSFVVGPMCAITRTTSEPPCHRACAEFAAHYCPFLTHPLAKRRERDAPSATVSAAGIPIDRNPGVACVWTCKSYKTFNVRSEYKGNQQVGGGTLIEMGDPYDVTWFAEGRIALDHEIAHSIKTGIPILREQADGDSAAGHRALDQTIATFKAKVFDFETRILA